MAETPSPKRRAAENACGSFRLPPSGHCPTGWRRASDWGAGLLCAARGDLKAPLDRPAGEAALQPGRDTRERIERDQLARLVEGDEVADPAERRHVGDR